MLFDLFFVYFYSLSKFISFSLKTSINCRKLFGFEDDDVSDTSRDHGGGGGGIVLIFYLGFWISLISKKRTSL